MIVQPGDSDLHENQPKAPPSCAVSNSELDRARPIPTGTAKDRLTAEAAALCGAIDSPQREALWFTLSTALALLDESDSSQALRKFDQAKVWMDICSLGLPPNLDHNAKHLFGLLEQELFSRTTEFDGLAVALERHAVSAKLQPGTSVPDQMEMAISVLGWPGLTRVLNVEGLSKAIIDPKRISPDGKLRVYVPTADRTAVEYYRKIVPDVSARLGTEIVVEEIPADITDDVLQWMENYPGILTLAYEVLPDGEIAPLPYGVPGGRFNEKFGWDSKFLVDGLLRSVGGIALARAMVEHAAYLIEHIGMDPNASSSYLISRPQPPFITRMGIAVAEWLTDPAERRELLRKTVIAAVTEYENVWSAPDYVNASTGLTRYHDRGRGVPREVEPHVFDDVVKPYIDRSGVPAEQYLAEYRTGKRVEPELDKVFRHDRSMRCSGRDVSNGRIFNCDDLVPVCLNSELYRIESDIANILETEFGGTLERGSDTPLVSADWRDRAEYRRERMNATLWDEAAGSFFDYNFASNKPWNYVSPTCLYPLWAGLATQAQADRMVREVLPKLKVRCGLTGSDQASRDMVDRGEPRKLGQWDYPFGWAPDQMLIWEGLQRYGYADEARELAYRWAWMVTVEGLRHGGIVMEKYDVVAGSQEVHVEYGNQGYEPFKSGGAGFAWSNASVLVAYERVREDPELWRALCALKDPYLVFDSPKHVSAV